MSVRTKISGRAKSVLYPLADRLFWPLDSKLIKPLPTLNLLHQWKRHRSGFTVRVFRNASWGMWGVFFTAVIGVVQLGLVTRFLGVEHYGTLAVITVLPTMIQQFLGFRTWEWVARDCTAALEANNPKEAGHVAILGWLIDAIVACVVFLLILAGSGRYLDLTLGTRQSLPLAYLYGLVVLSNAVLPTAQALLRVLDRFGLLFALTMGSALLRLCLVFLASVVHPGLSGVIVAYTASSIIGSLPFFYVSRRLGSQRVDFPSVSSAWTYFRAHAKGTLSFLMAGYFEGSVLALSRNLDVMVLANLRGPGEVGLYRAGQAITTYFGGLVTPLANAVLPDIRRSVTLPAAQLRIRLARLTVVALPLFVMGGMLTFVLAPYLIVAIMGANFESASISARIMVWAVVIQGAFFWLPALLLTLGRQWLRALATIVGVAVQMLIWYALTPGYGQIGVAWGNVSLFVVYYAVASVVLRGARTGKQTSGERESDQQAVSPAL